MRALAIAVSCLLLLGCGDNDAPESGEVDVALNLVAADQCPRITSAVAAPAQTSVGGTIGVTATASDTIADGQGPTPCTASVMLKVDCVSGGGAGP